MEEVEFAPGSSIMTLGEPGEHLYVVTSGQVGYALLLLVFFFIKRGCTSFFLLLNAAVKGFLFCVLTECL